MNSFKQIVSRLNTEPTHNHLLAKLTEFVDRFANNPRMKHQLHEAVKVLLNALQNSESVIRIFLCAYNAPDGIGDAINLIGFTQMLKTLFSSTPQVQIRAIAYVNSEKLPNLKRVFSDGEQEDFYFCDLAQVACDSRAATSTITIFSSSLEHLPLEKRAFPPLKVLLRSCPSLESFCESCDLYLNIATPMNKETHPFDIVKSKGVVRSILETGAGQEFLCLRDYCPDVPEYFEVAMGYRKQEVGFKFDPTLLRFSKDVKNSQFREVMHAVNVNPRLCSVLFPRGLYDSSQVEAFSRRNRLCVGYLQSDAATQIAAELFMRTSNQHKNVFLICNLNAVRKLLDKKPDLKKSFSHISYHSADTAELHALDSEATRELTIIDFRDISEETKFALFVLADMVLGSGDNSRVETMLCRLPFWQILPWKGADISKFLEAIDKDFPKLFEYFLLQYAAAAWNYLTFEETQLKQMTKLLNDSEEQLVHEWREFQQKVLRQHNVENYVLYAILTCLNNQVTHLDPTKKILGEFCQTLERTCYALPHKPQIEPPQLFDIWQNRLLQMYDLVLQMIQKNNVQALKAHYAKFPYFSVNNAMLFKCMVPLVVIAAEKGAVACLRFLLQQPDTDPNVSDRLIEILNYPKTGMTALHYAARNGKLKCATLLLEHPEIERQNLDLQNKMPEDYCGNNLQMQALFQAKTKVLHK